MLLYPGPEHIRHTAPQGEIRNHIIHKPSTTGHAHTGHGHVKYHSTHVDLPSDHGNNSTNQ